MSVKKLLTLILEVALDLKRAWHSLGSLSKVLATSDGEAVCFWSTGGGGGGGNVGDFNALLFFSSWILWACKI